MPWKNIEFQIDLKISKIEDEIYKQTVEKYNQIRDTNKPQIKLKEIEDLNKEIMELQKQYNDTL